MKMHFAVLGLLLGACASAQSADIAIRDATVVDVAGGVLVPHQTVLIADNRIVAVGAADEINIGPDTEIIEGTGAYVIPGLWAESRVPEQANDGKCGVLRRSIGYDRGESGVSSYCGLQTESNAGWAWLRIPMEFSK